MSVESLIEDNIHLVHFVAKKYFPTLRFDEDLISEGMIGLWLAAKSFDEDKGIKFITYATTCIYNHICKFIRSYNHQNRLQTISMYEQITEKMTIEDMLSYQDNLESNFVISEAVSQLFKTMKPRSQEIMKMYISGMNQTEISKIKGFTQVNVSRIIIRERKRLQMILGMSSGYKKRTRKQEGGRIA